MRSWWVQRLRMPIAASVTMIRVYQAGRSGGDRATERREENTRIRAMFEKQTPGPLTHTAQRVLAFALYVIIAGCATAPSEPVDRKVDITTVKRARDEAAPMTQLELQAQLMSFADRFLITLAGVWDPVEFGDTTPELRSLAHARWLYPSVAASGIAAAPDPKLGFWT